jgi:hypothetical protein
LEQRGIRLISAKYRHTDSGFRPAIAFDISIPPDQHQLRQYAVTLVDGRPRGAGNAAATASAMI